MKTELEYDDGRMHDSVQIAGDFSGWKGLDMEYTGIGTLYKREIDFDSNRWMYKFIVDGQWVLREGLPTTTEAGSGIVNHLFECHDNVILDVDKDIAHVFQKTRSHSYHSSMFPAVEDLEADLEEEEEEEELRDSSAVGSDEDEAEAEVQEEERGLVCGEECRRLSDENKTPFKSSYGFEPAMHHRHLFSHEERSLSHISEGSQTPLGDSAESPAPFCEAEEKKPYEQSGLRSSLTNEQVRSATQQLVQEDDDYIGDGSAVEARFEEVAPLNFRSKKPEENEEEEQEQQEGVCPHETPGVSSKYEAAQFGDKFVASQFGVTDVAPSFAEEESVESTRIIDPTQLPEQQKYRTGEPTQPPKQQTYPTEEREDSDERYESARESAEENYDSDQLAKPFNDQPIESGNKYQPVKTGRFGNYGTQISTEATQLPSRAINEAQLFHKDESQLPTQGINETQPSTREVSELPSKPVKVEEALQPAAKGVSVEAYPPEKVVDESTRVPESPKYGAYEFSSIPRPSETKSAVKNKKEVSVPGQALNGEQFQEQPTERDEVNGKHVPPEPTEVVPTTTGPVGVGLGLGGAITAATAAATAANNAAKPTTSEKLPTVQTSSAKDEIAHAVRTAADKVKNGPTSKTTEPPAQRSGVKESIANVVKTAEEKVKNAVDQVKPDQVKPITKSETTESPIKASQAAARKEGQLEEPQSVGQSGAAMSGASRAFTATIPGQQGPELTNKSSDLTAISVDDETAQLRPDATQKDLSNKASQATTMTVDELRDAIAADDESRPVTDYDHQPKPATDTDNVKRSPSSGRRIEVPNQSLRDQIHHHDKKGKRPGFLKRLLTKMKS
ncbi:hypothetical protein TRVA0_005S02630 [Trichomonascus vanleenenianus]|uniref:glycogen-binding domain-containing protein n=1 Tax=Trichomonascus vanleenenianus TaxID=2268995 RepID=UPI003ECAF070